MYKEMTDACTLRHQLFNEEILSNFSKAVDIRSTERH